MASSSSSSSKSFDTQDKCTIPINSHNSNNNGMNSKKKQNYGAIGVTRVLAHRARWAR